MKLAPEVMWGARKPDGTWGGQFGMVVRNECDLLVGPATPLLDRFSALQPLPQYFLAETGHCGGLLDKFVTNVFGYVNAFDWEVWTGLFCSMMVVSLLVALIDVRFKCTGLGTAYYSALLDLFSIFLMEASPRVTRSSAKRWIIGTWWLAVFVLASGFTGHMKASLTMKDEGGRLDTVHDIALKPDVVPVIIKGTLFMELFQGTQDKNQQAVWARANRMKSILPAGQVFTREVFDDVLLGKKCGNRRWCSWSRRCSTTPCSTCTRAFPGASFTWPGRRSPTRQWACG